MDFLHGHIFDGLTLYRFPPVLHSTVYTVLYLTLCLCTLYKYVPRRIPRNVCTRDPWGLFAFHDINKSWGEPRRSRHQTSEMEFLDIYITKDSSLLLHVIGLNMKLDLQTLFAQLYSSAETPQLPPPPNPLIGAHIRGCCWSAKIDDISMWPPASGGF